MTFWGVGSQLFKTFKTFPSLNAQILFYFFPENDFFDYFFFFQHYWEFSVQLSLQLLRSSTGLNCSTGSFISSRHNLVNHVKTNNLPPLFCNSPKLMISFFVLLLLLFLLSCFFLLSVIAHHCSKQTIISLYSSKQFVLTPTNPLCLKLISACVFLCVFVVKY